MKAILLSIRPEHLLNILNGKKTIEIRKSKLPLNIPVYLYCTKAKNKFDRLESQNGEFYYGCPTYTGWEKQLNGKVVAKCIFSEVDNYELTYKFNGDWAYLIPEEDLKKTCLLYEEIEAYGDPKPLNFYHITNVEIFDTPKELGEFGALDKAETKRYNGFCKVYKPITKAPKSWCYVEEFK